MRDKVSIVIPIYNVEAYLERCLDSIIEQTLKEIEIICVDDCSTDNSREILSDIAKRDSRIKVVLNEKNMGVSYSRNCGIGMATGQYIMFVDPDDYLERDACEFLYRKAQHNGIDVLRFGFNSNRESESRVSVYHENSLKKVDSGYDAFSNLVLEDSIHIWSYVWLLFINKDFLILSGIKFEIGIIYEDLVFTYLLYQKAQRCICVNDRKYFYCVRDDSLSKSRQSTKSIASILVGMNLILNAQKNLAGERYVNATYVFLSRMEKMLELFELDEPLNEVLTNSELINLYYRLVNMSLYKKRSIVNRVSCFLLAQSFGESGFYIYGAGKIAKSIFSFFVNEDINVSIKGFLVSEKTNNPDSLWGLPVIEMKAFEKTGNDNIILGVSEKYSKEVEETLEQYGLCNVFRVVSSYDANELM